MCNEEYIMKNSIFTMILLLNFLIFLFSTSNAQPIQFSPDIVIDTLENMAIRQHFPVISLDQHGNLGIIYSETLWNGQYGTDYFRYIRSDDGGQSFYGKSTIEGEPVPGIDYTSGTLVYDTLNNPIVSYIFYNWPSKVIIKKSHDGGNSFGSRLFSEWTYLYPLFNLFFDENNILYGVFPGIEDKPVVIKSYDQGETYPERHVVYTDSVYVAPEYISLVKCGNGDFLCFYSGINFSLFNNVHVFYSRSTDGCATWGPPVLFDSTDKRSTWPTVVTNGDDVYVAYFASTSSSAEILFSKSNNNGIFFEQPICITDLTTVIWNPTPDITFHPEVGICVIWDKSITPDVGVQFSRSTNYGNSFSSPINVNYGVHYKNNHAIAISDSREIFVVSKDTASRQVVLNKAQVPLAIKETPVITAGAELQVWPNPFNATVQLSTKNVSVRRITIFNLVGEVVFSVPDSEIIHGRNKNRWRFHFAEKKISSGVYIIQVQGKYRQYSRKILYLK